MKWKNKGHEFDCVYQNIISKKKFYLFGAGDYGRQFVHLFNGEIQMMGVIDNNIEKQGKIVEGLPCVSFEVVKKDPTVGIIVTMSQIARTEPLLQLKNAGFVLGEDCFLIEEFLSVYYVYKYDKVYFSSISILPSTTCNLKCKNCLNFNSYTDHFYVREWENIISDIDLFFSCVDRIMLFHVSGGEPMLYRPIAELIEYIDKVYGDRIDTLRTVTNGTIIPPDSVLEKLSHCRVEIIVDDYRESVPAYKNNFLQLLRFLYKGIIINHNKKLSQPTLKRRFFKKKAAFFSWPGLGKEWC